MAVEKIILDIQAQTAKARKDMNSLRTSTQGVNKEVNRTNALFKKAAVTMAAFFSIQAIVGFTKKIIEVRQEFEKYNAVLTVALGSAKAAAKEFEMIKKFAAETPFQVIQLTNAFVKLVNQGFKPTKEEMRKLGDVAASTGKSFDQLTEAIIDATVGEFERLKEFGIRAQKMGDQVTFTFKEVRTQVDFTEDAIRKYILALGDLQGVSGSMAAISETLGGRISMLGDAWDSFLDTLGGKTSGTMVEVIDGLTDLLNVMSDTMTEAETAQQKIDSFADSLKDLTEEQRRAALVSKIGVLGLSIEAIDEEIDRMGKYSEEATKASGVAAGFMDQIRLLKEQFEELAKVPPLSTKEKEKEEAARLAAEEKRLAAEEKAHKERMKLLKAEGDYKLKGLEEDQEMYDESLENTYSALEREAGIKKEFRDKVKQDEKDAITETLEFALKNLAIKTAAEIQAANTAIFIERTKAEIKMDIIAGAFGVAQTLAGESFALQKVLAIAESIVSTYLGAQYAFTWTTQFAGPIAGAIARRAAITRGWINTAMIAGTALAGYEEGGFTGKSKYKARDKGGRIAGFVHEDEFVFNKDKTRTLRPLFEDIHNNRIDIHGLAALTRRGTMRTTTKLNADILEQEVKKIYRKMSEEQTERPVIIHHGKGYTKTIGNTTINVNT